MDHIPPASSEQAASEQPKSTSVKTKVHHHKPKALGVLLIFLTSLSLGFFGGWVGSLVRANNPNAISGNTEQAKQIAKDESNLISSIAKDMGPSVVSVNVSGQRPQQDVFGHVRTYRQESAGTGFIISDKGEIVTNRHVVPAGTTTVSVTLWDGSVLNNVEVIGRTSDSDPLDVAFLRVKDAKGKKLKPAKLGDSGRVQVGDKVIAIGNALGEFQNTVTSGIISGFGRNVQAEGGDQVEALQNLFQTDAAINEGNSGGPLVNSNGEVIGINTAVAGGGAENIGFAIPIDDVRGLIKSVLAKGTLERPFLGVRYVSLTDDLADQFGLSVKRGAYIAPSRGQPAILPGSPASKAGLQEKDVVVKVNNQKIDENSSLTTVIGRSNVGDKVTLSVIRDGKEIKVPVTLESAP